jgi:hypothetical protein
MWYLVVCYKSSTNVSKEIGASYFAVPWKCKLLSNPVVFNFRYPTEEYKPPFPQVCCTLLAPAYKDKPWQSKDNASALRKQ